MAFPAKVFNGGSKFVFAEICERSSKPMGKISEFSRTNKRIR